MRKIRKIESYMTAMPHSINQELTIGAAKEMMKKHDVRHLPVQEGGRLVGVLSDRDLKLALSFDEAGKLLVSDVMTPEPYAVSPDASLEEVSLTMAAKRYGCALVQDDRLRVVGIFTASDGLQALGELLGGEGR